jgi:gliding motility-associated-like protein
MKRLLFVLLVLLSAHANAQITGVGMACLTNYTNGVQNDTIYYVEAPMLGQLTATPSSGAGPFNFVWAFFTPSAGAWVAYTTQNGLPSSTISNLQPGAYNVTIYDVNGNVIGCETAWVGQFINGSSTSGEVIADIFPIEPSCLGMHLQGQITYTPGSITGGPITGYSNLPPNPMLINAQTAISVCFTATHTWVSDIGFYLVGPPSCGSPTITLSPNPGSIGQPLTCLPGDNVSNLCFSTESTGNLNICATATPLSGTYGSYGAGATPINWSTLYGCDAAAPGWSVQIYDCVGGDIGFLTDATININGINSCGGNQTMNYTTPPGFSSFIADNSCSPATASIFTVPPGNNYTPITCEYGYVWSNSLGAYMDDSLISLLGATFPVNIDLTNVILWTDNTMTQALPLQNVTFYLDPYIDCNGSADGTGCAPGGDNTMVGDSEPFVYIDPQPIFIPYAGVVCDYESTAQLPQPMVSGQWSGPSLIDINTGLVDVSALGAGSYMYDFIPNDPCFYPGSTTLDIGTFIVAYIDQPAPLCENDSPILLSSNWSGFYDGSGITDSFAGIFDPSVAGVGTHLIQFSSGSMCGGGGSVSVVVNPSPVLNITLDSEVCYGLPTNLNATGAESYLWSPATYLNDESSSSPISTPTSDITYSVIGSNSFGCSAEASVSLTVVALPEIFVTSPPTSICPGGSAVISSAGTVGEYEWTSSTGPISGNSPSINVSPAQTTYYSITVTDGCGLQASDGVLITVHPGEFVNAGPDVVICEGEIAELTATTFAPNATFSWNGVISGPTISVGNSGTYNVQMLTENLCPYEDEVQVTVSAFPTLTVSDDAEICSNQPFNLTASGASYYTWSPSTLFNNPTSASTSVTISQATTVTVVGENIYGCETTEQISLTVVPDPTVTAEQVSPVCSGTEVALNATGSDGNYLWTPSANVQNAFTPNASVTPTSTTTFVISLTDECGVTVTDEVLVTVENSVIVNAGEDVSYCEGDSAEVAANVSGTYTSLIWTTANGNINPTEQNQLSLNNLLEGDYAITVTTALGCEYADVVSVSEISLPVFYVASPIELCPGESVTITAGLNWDQVVWNNAIYSAQLEVSNEGTYSVVVTENGCSSEGEVVVTEVLMPIIELGPDQSICEDDAITFSLPVSAAWNTGINGSQLSVSQAGTYTATYQDGQCTVTDSVHVDIMPLPNLNLPASIVGCLEEPVTIYAYQPENFYYIWSTGETTDQITVSEFNDYTVTAGNNCGIISATVEVDFEDCTFSLFIPNSFTPDNDGINDVWKIGSYNIASLKIVIIDRWGMPVFSAEKPDFVWTGGVNEGDFYAGDGVYFYQMEFESEKGVLGTREGHIILIR